MPARERHREQARANHDLAWELANNHNGNPAKVQWAATLAFYAALHAVEAHLADRQLHSRSHVDRDGIMTSVAAEIPPETYADYEQLKDWSMDARYRLRQFSLDLVLQYVLPTMDRILAFAQIDVR